MCGTIIAAVCVTSLVAILIGFFVGCYCHDTGYARGVESQNTTAGIAGCGEYSLNKKTGKIEFKFGSAK